ncbi:MAG: diguanylate cyclase [Clostridiaceae bacterium]|nr:diguanylate cyclase [Clostridiaceae bacterium]
MAVVTVFWSACIRVLNGSNYARTSLVLCAAMCFYILGYAMELNSATPSQIEFWNLVEYIGIPFVSALWLTIALMYTGHFTRCKKALVLAIYLIPIISLILRFTNAYHHLYFLTEGYEEEYGKLIFVKKTGPWMYVQSIHSMLMILAAMGLLIHDSVQKEDKQRGKILLITAASAFAVAGLLLSQIKPFNITIDYMALCLPITCVMVILAIAQFDLLETRSLARSRVFEYAGDAFLLINKQNRILDYNSSARQLFESINIRLNNGYISTLLSQVPDILEALKNKENSVVKLRMKTEDRYYEITTTNIDNRNATRGWIKTIRDITEIHQLNEDLKRQAMTDELSVLNNRRAFIRIGTDWVSEANKTGKTLHLSMLDIDYFKKVNDQFGHPIGDLVIREFSEMLKDHFGADSLIARLGGEEFAILQAGVNDEKTLRTLNAFLNMIRRHQFCYHGNQLQITVSAGVTRSQPNQTLESMIRNADKALYLSKNRGRDCVTVV